ncbi:unnamed protein product, partial [marine sediment metagenome]
RGKCRVKVENGFLEEHGIETQAKNLSPLTDCERKFLTKRQELEGYRLACQARIQGNVVVFVPEESRLRKQIVRKAATERTVDLKPAVRKYYVEMSLLNVAAVAWWLEGN